MFLSDSILKFLRPLESIRTIRTCASQLNEPVVKRIFLQSVDVEAVQAVKYHLLEFD